MHHLFFPQSKYRLRERNLHHIWYLSSHFLFRQLLDSSLLFLPIPGSGWNCKAGLERDINMLGQNPCQRSNCVSGAPCKVFRMFPRPPTSLFACCLLFCLSRISRCFLARPSALRFVFRGPLELFSFLLFWFWWHVKAVWTQCECRGSHCLLSVAALPCVSVCVCVYFAKRNMHI